MDDDRLPLKTFSLDEVAAMVLPPNMKDPTRWLMVRLNSGEIAGYKIGRAWRMTYEDVEALIERGRKRPSSPRPRVEHQPLSLTPTSRRRLAKRAADQARRK
jgi:hypothetical protein